MKGVLVWFYISLAIKSFNILPTCGDCNFPTVSDHSKVNVSPNKTTYSAWEIISLVCSAGFTGALGPDYSYCDSGSFWNPNPSMFTCFAGCSAPNVTSDTHQYPDGGNISDSRGWYDHNDVINYACALDPSEYLVGPATATCIDGLWTPDWIPYCTVFPTSLPDNSTTETTPMGNSTTNYSTGHTSTAFPSSIQTTESGIITYSQPNITQNGGATHARRTKEDDMWPYVVFSLVAASVVLAVAVVFLWCCCRWMLSQEGSYDGYNK